MATSQFPKYLDKTVSFLDAAVLSPIHKPVTEATPELFNWLASKLASTQRECAFDFASLNSTFFDLVGEDKNIAKVLERRVRIESGFAHSVIQHPQHPNPDSVETQTVLFANTTNGGTTQRFLPNVAPKILVYANRKEWIYTIPTDAQMLDALWKESDPTLNDERALQGFQWLVDSSGYNYGFTHEYTIDNVSSSSVRYHSNLIRFIAIQSWEH
jgi:hypothetical protein